MGLDMYAFTTSADIPAVDFKDPKDSADLYYWREHPYLYGWMEQLYRRKGGRKVFNCASVRLDVPDLNDLETIVRRGELPHTWSTPDSSRIRPILKISFGQPRGTAFSSSSSRGEPTMPQTPPISPSKPDDLVQGTLEMLILKTLALEPNHGYGVALRIEQISGGVFRVNPGSLLPALSRMERAGHVHSEWRATENNRRAKYYQLTPQGHRALTHETAQWQRQQGAITRILEA
jgi:PadR family transcriptional regulator, regulatory protein PadR